MLRKIAHLTLLASLIAFAVPAHAHAAGRGGVTDPKIGNDISFPQCGKTLPSGQAFGIVGVNGGKATTTNTCLATQLKWAQSTQTSSSVQPKVQLYVNTANPYNDIDAYKVTTWPKNNDDPAGVSTLNNANPSQNNPYGACSGTTTGNGYDNSYACSWQYGWNRSVEAVRYFKDTAATVSGLSVNPADYKWWLDVETMNSWQAPSSSPEALAKNAATLEGFKQYYDSLGVPNVGLYSTVYQWGQIAGTNVTNPPAAYPALASNLKNLDSWLAGASSATDAKKRCTTANGLTGGKVTLYQYISRNLDYNYSCI